MIPFRPVNGPLDPLPAPALKPREQAREVGSRRGCSPARRGRCSSRSTTRPILVPAGFGAAAAAAQAGRGRASSPPAAAAAARRGCRPAGPAAQAATAALAAARMTGIRACVFDAYGTLFDVHSAVGRLRPRLGAQADALSQLWRTKQLEYTWLRSLMGRHADFWQITGEALDYALARTGVDPARCASRCCRPTSRSTPIPRCRRCCAGCARAGLKTAILSNGAPGMLQAGARERRDRRPARCDPLGRGGRHLQARPAGLPARGRPAGRAGGRDRLPVVQRLGRPRRRLLRPAPGVDQPLGRPARAPARRAPSTSFATSPALPALLGV